MRVWSGLGSLGSMVVNFVFHKRCSFFTCCASISFSRITLLRGVCEVVVNCVTSSHAYEFKAHKVSYRYKRFVVCYVSLGITSYTSHISQNKCVRFKLRVFCDVAPYNHIKVDRCFRGAYCLHRQGDEWSSTQIRGYYLKIRHGRFLSNHFQFLIHLSFLHSTQYSLSHWKSFVTQTTNH
jgi:hypothetical protein